MRTNYLLITLISCAIFSVFNLGATEMKFRLVTSYQQLQATDTSEILICYESATEKLTFLCDVAKIPDASSSNVRVVTQSYKTTASTSTVMQNLNDSTLLFRKYNETQDYKSYVWKITRGVSSFLKGAYGYIGYYSDNAYLYSYGHHYVNMATRAKRFRFNIDPVSGSTIEWTGEYMNGSYILGPAYVYITATSPYISKTPFNWKIYKRMNPVTFDMGGYSEYATPTAYSSDEATNVKLPYIVLKNATFASYVKFKGWSTVRDDANYIIGKGGDIIPTLPEGTVLYAIFDVTKFTIYFDEGDYGTCKVDSIKSLLPFALPDIDLNMGYYFKGWYSLNQGGIVGQPGDVYPQGATVIMEDDKLTAQYGHAFDVISWSTSGVLLQFLDDALYVNATTETDAQTTVTMLSTAKIDAGLYWVNISNMSAHEGEKLLFHL